MKNTFFAPSAYKKNNSIRKKRPHDCSLIKNISTYEATIDCFLKIRSLEEVLLHKIIKDLNLTAKYQLI